MNAFFDTNILVAAVTADSKRSAEADATSPDGKRYNSLVIDNSGKPSDDS